MKYRFLRTGERIKKGDEEYTSGKWKKIANLYIGDKKMIAGNWLRRPIKKKGIASKSSSNIGYTAALKEKVNKYFGEQRPENITNFVKAIKRLNAKHCV